MLLQKEIDALLHQLLPIIISNQAQTVHLRENSNNSKNSIRELKFQIRVF
jgi:hypothetical protein